MKKLIYGAAIALALGAASCGKTGDTSADKFFSQEASDSLLMAFGQAAGYGLNGQITNAMASDSTLTKEAFLKGLQYAMAADTSDAYINGMITGLQIQKQLKYFRRMGVSVDQSVALNSFKSAFMADSLPGQFELQLLDAQYRKWSDSLTQAQHRYQVALLQSDPQAIENAEKGATYIKAQKTANDSVQISDSGLGYKIVNAGEGEKVSPSGRAVVKYVARNADGRVVDQMGPAPMSMASRVPGLREGLAMLGKGGKAVLYVPGELAYGVEVPQNLNIGLNEMLIYEVEVTDVMNPQSAPQVRP